VEILMMIINMQPLRDGLAYLKENPDRYNMTRMCGIPQPDGSFVEICNSVEILERGKEPGVTLDLAAAALLYCKVSPERAFIADAVVFANVVFGDDSDPLVEQAEALLSSIFDGSFWGIQAEEDEDFEKLNDITIEMQEAAIDLFEQTFAAHIAPEAPSISGNLLVPLSIPPLLRYYTAAGIQQMINEGGKEFGFQVEHDPQTQAYFYVLDGVDSRAFGDDGRYENSIAALCGAFARLKMRRE
jgi:hypothetical protein